MDNNNQTITEFLTVKEACVLLRSSPVTLWRLRKKGELPFNRIAAKILFRRSDLENFLTRNQRNGEVQK
jgi:excisionase family DNA binding protein